MVSYVIKKLKALGSIPNTMKKNPQNICGINQIVLGMKTNEERLGLNGINCI